MALNGIQPLGDDQKWKEQVEREIAELKRLVKILTAQVNSRSK